MHKHSNIMGVSWHWHIKATRQHLDSQASLFMGTRAEGKTRIMLGKWLSKPDKPIIRLGRMPLLDVKGQADTTGAGGALANNANVLWRGGRVKSLHGRGLKDYQHRAPNKMMLMRDSYTYNVETFTRPYSLIWETGNEGDPSARIHSIEFDWDVFKDCQFADSKGMLEFDIECYIDSEIRPEAVGGDLRVAHWTLPPRPLDVGLPVYQYEQARELDMTGNDRGGDDMVDAVSAAMRMVNRNIPLPTLDISSDIHSSMVVETTTIIDPMLEDPDLMKAYKQLRGKNESRK